MCRDHTVAVCRGERVLASSYTVELNKNVAARRLKTNDDAASSDCGTRGAGGVGVGSCVAGDLGGHGRGAAKAPNRFINDGGNEHRTRRAVERGVAVTVSAGAADATL